jgi:hypothetical protein
LFWRTCLKITQIFDAIFRDFAIGDNQGSGKQPPDPDWHAMKLRFLPHSLAWFCGFALLAGAVKAQTIAEALDSPGVAWTSSGAVTPLNAPPLSHDSADVLRLDVPTVSNAPYSWVKTTVIFPSVVEFWHRSRDLNAITTVGRNGRPAAVSSYWKKERWLQWPAGWGDTGDLEIGNLGALGSGSLYLDEFTTRPPLSTGFAEALDFPGFVRGLISPISAVPLAESWLAPDGVDAVVFPTAAADLEVVFPGTGIITFRSAGGEAVPAVQGQIGQTGVPMPAFEMGDRTWGYVSGGGSYRFLPRSGLGQPALYNQMPITMDALEQVPGVSINDALDAPGLTFSVTGIASGVGASSVAPDGDALLCLQRTDIANPQSEISLTANGPGIVKFSYLGSVSLTRSGQFVAGGGITTTWQTLEIPIYQSGETITWKTTGAGFWLNAISVLPPTVETSISGLLNAPGLSSEILVPVRLDASIGSNDGDLVLSIVPLTPIPLQPVLRLHFSGASLVSLNMRGAQFRIDGGAWQSFSQTNIPNTLLPAIAIAHGSGPHTLEVTGPALLDQFKVIPLTPVPLAEAIDAPGLTFTTSPDFPFTGYRMLPGTGYSGDHAAISGFHSTAGTPWLETSLNGPGLLSSKASLKAYTLVPGGVLSLADFPKSFLDGVLTGPNFAEADLWIPPGPHTVRWVQNGNQIQTGTGTLVTLDAVSFTPLPALSFSEALDTPNRSWTSGGTGAIAALARPDLALDGVDSVVALNGISPPGWVETTVQLPCAVNFRGWQMGVSLGNGPQLYDLIDTTGFGHFRMAIPGSGPARVRLTFLGTDSQLDMVSFEEPEDFLLNEVTLNTPGIAWRQYGDIPWRVFRDENGGPDRYRGAEGAKIWMTATVNSPCQIRVVGAVASLPDHGNRSIGGAGWIPYSGPQRVVVGWPATSLVHDDFYRACAPISDWITIPGVTWTSGGDVPWISTFDQSAWSGFVWPGETSWLEAAVSGPGVLEWQSIISLSGGGFHILCDGIAVPFTQNGKLHLGSGPHHVRWQVAKPVGTSRTGSGPIMILTSISFTPQLVDSVSAVLSQGSLNFLESSVGPPGSEWQVVDDPSLPGQAIRGSGNSGFFAPVFPAPGRLDSFLKMAGNGVIQRIDFEDIATAAPFPWLPTTLRAPPLREGFQTSFAQATFTPFPTVGVAEALDLSGVTWTAQSTPPGLWRALTDPGASSNDPDSLYLIGAQMGDQASFETTLTGPLDITTELTKTASIGMRFLIDGDVAATDAQLSARRNATGIVYPTVRIPSGFHLVRWEITATMPLLGSDAPIIHRITASIPSAAQPDVPTLLDNAGLTWNANGLLTAITSDTQDGVDALSVGFSGRINFPLTGPGMASFYMKGLFGSLSGIGIDGILMPNSILGPPAWRQYTVPIPAGRHSLSISGGGSTILLDQFSFTSLPALTPEAALDAPAGVTIALGNSEITGAAAYPGLSEDGVDSLLLMPSSLHGLALTVPPLSSITLRVRSVSGTGTLSCQDFYASISTAWSSFGFSTTHVGGTNTIYLRSDTLPVLLDQLTVISPSPSTQYFPWAAAAGLSTSQQDTRLDPDNDGMTNFAEYANGLNPTVADNSRIGTDMLPGLPEGTIFNDGTGNQFLEVRYWRRKLLAATVETATQPSGVALLGDPGGWAGVANGSIESNKPGDWVRSVWRSPTPIMPGTRQFARVRTYLP